MDQTRKERNVAPEPKSETQAQKEAPTNDVPAQPSSAPASDPSHKPSSASGPSGDAVAAEWVKRERAITEAENKIRNAQTQAEKRAAEAEAAEARAAKALAELQNAKNEPLEFLAKVGMSKEEWEEFVAGGGKMTAQAKRLRALEAKHSEMEERYKQLEEKAQQAELKRRIDAENAAFQSELGSYVFISKIGGLDSVRQKQAAIRHAEGREISLKQAADLVEEEIKTSLGPLLKHDDVRRTLNLDLRDQPGLAVTPQAKTLTGAEGGQRQKDAVKEEDPAPWDWAAKKRKAFKLIQAAQKRI